jgi:hypothetical protein
VILILTSCDDPTAGRVEAELLSRGVRCHRIDLSDFPQRITTSARLGGLGRWTGEIRHDDGWTVALEDVTAIYYRRPTNFNPASGLDRAERRFAIAEARAGFGGVLACLPVQWVNHPFRVADAEFKPRQLSSARESGFCVPETLITNDGYRARHFVETLSPHVIYKPLGGGFHRDNNNDLSIIYATRIAVESLQDDEIASTSHTFQRFIDKNTTFASPPPDIGCSPPPSAQKAMTDVLTGALTINRLITLTSPFPTPSGRLSISTYVVVGCCMGRSISV